MPRPKNAHPIHVIFEEFVAGLSSLIKEKVSEATQVAVTDFLNSKLMAQPAAKAEPAKPVRRRRRRRTQKVGAKAKVRLSKHGKRIGRPPKAKA